MAHAMPSVTIARRGGANFMPGTSGRKKKESAATINPIPTRDTNNDFVDWLVVFSDEVFVVSNLLRKRLSQICETSPDAAQTYATDGRKFSSR